MKKHSIELKNHLIRLKNSLKSKLFFWKKIKINENLKKMFLEILFYATVPAFLINYSLWGIFGVPFHWYSFSAFGIFLYLIKVELMNIWAHLWFRIPIE